MNKFDFDFNEEMAVMDKYIITPNELAVIKYIMLLQNEYPGDHFLRLVRILHENKIELRDILTSLQSKGIILKSYKIPLKGQKFNPLDIPLIRTLLKLYGEVLLKWVKNFLKHIQCLSTLMVL